tara:strand:- start:533 stop:892 length:360 start_codon:yes stop_codon:yes gene_type:complete
MITCLPNEVLYYIFLNFSDFFDTVNLKVVNKTFKKLLDDNFYKEFAIHVYGEKFWEIAAMRSTSVSKPCKTSFDELRRIETFQSVQLKETGKRCKNQEFYNLWIAMEPKMKQIVDRFFV